MDVGGTLADEFLLDFEDQKGGENEDEEVNEQGNNNNVDEGGVQEMDQGEDVVVDGLPTSLRGSRRFTQVMRDIDNMTAGGDDSEELSLISKANELVLEVLDHQAKVCRYVKQLYAERFPELEGLVTDTMEYLRAVQAIGNESDITKVELDKVIPGHLAMIVKIGASTTDGHAMSEETLAKVLSGCQEGEELESARKKLLAFIESRMNTVAPNLTTLVGPEVAAALVTAAGGLEQLGQMHANMIRVLGIQQKELMGMSTATQITHAGHIQKATVLHNCPPDIKTQAIRQLAGRAALAARVDAQQSHKRVADRSAWVTVGREYLEEIETKIAKMQEPPPPRSIKALPVPKTGNEGKAKKRGGEQARRRKAKYKQTELRKQQSRLAFGEVKDEGMNDIMGADLGLVGSSMGTGRSKVAVEDTGILKGLSKRRKAEIARALEPAVGPRSNLGRASQLPLANAGMKSSLALEGDRGIELVEKPQLQQQQQQQQQQMQQQGARYFDSTGFAVPQAPVRK